MAPSRGSVSRRAVTGRAPRKVSAALKAYAKLVMSADKGAVRDLSLLDD
jgi:dihydroxyacid dehydratase/phosphogluconate dehydratase